MSYYDDYFEPSDYEIMVDEFKETLRNSVKQEVKDEIADLRNQLKKLEYIRDNYNKIKKDFDIKLREYEYEVKKAKENARKERITELLQDMPITVYVIKQKSEYKYEKCDKCDDEREIHFVSPMGKKLSEPCKCAERRIKYTVEEAQIYGLQINKNNTITRYYINKSGDCSFMFSRIEDNTEFQYVDKRKGYFLSKERAEAYCDWANENNLRWFEIKE